MAKIVVTKILPDELNEILEEKHEAVFIDDQAEDFEKRLSQEIESAEGLLTAGVKIDEAFLKKAPDLKVVSDITVGYDNFDLEAMKERRVAGTHTPYVLDDTVADLTFGLLLSAARRISEMDRDMRAGGWTSLDDTPRYGVDVHHKTLGIIGMGRIGEKIAKRASAGFDMEVLYHNRHQKPEVEKALDVSYAEMDRLLADSDFVVLLTPLTDATHHLMGEKEFRAMKPSSVFVNVSRGKTVDEAALIKALENKEILAAGLDVFDQEPINQDNPLLKMENVTLTPHIGSAVTETRLNMAKHAIENLLQGLEGEKPVSVVKELASLYE